MDLLFWQFKLVKLEIDYLLQLLGILIIDLGIYAWVQLGLFRVEMRVGHCARFSVVLGRFGLLIRGEVVRHNLIIVRH